MFLSNESVAQSFESIIYCKEIPRAFIITSQAEGPHLAASKHNM